MCPHLPTLRKMLIRFLERQSQEIFGAELRVCESWEKTMGEHEGGTRSGSTKSTTSDYLQIDARRWQRDGLLTPELSFECQWLCDGKQIASMRVQVESDRVILSNCHLRNDAEPWQSKEYQVLIECTRCNLGGSRAWFRCPRKGCDRRVAILYLDGTFACRQCCQLAYNSQRESARERALHRAQAIREKLGGSGNLGAVFPRKPNGMHWRTYQRLRSAYQKAEASSSHLPNDFGK